MLRRTIPYQLAAYSLAFLICITSLGLSLDVHYCGGDIKSFNLFGKAKSCLELAGLEKETVCVAKASSSICPIFQKNSCCHNKATYLKANAVQASNYFSTLLDSEINFLPAIFMNDQIEFAVQVTRFAQYKPPLLSRDLSVLFDTFLL